MADIKTVYDGDGWMLHYGSDKVATFHFTIRDNRVQIEYELHVDDLLRKYETIWEDNFRFLHHLADRREE